MARRQFKIPFAATGDTVSIPETTQPDGSVSMQQGYGFDYQRDPQTDPLAKVFPRDAHNGLLNEITASIGEIQQYGYPLWVPEGAPYDLNARVRHGDKIWVSLIANNSGEPSVSGSWGADDRPGQATQDVAGIAKIATRTQTLEGMDDSTIITPSKLRWGISGSLGVNGYIAFPTWLFGLILQWGRFDAAANQVGSVSFPLAFTADCYFGEIVLQRTAANATVKRVEALSKTALTYNFDSWSTTYPVVTHRWFALGV